MEVSIMAHFAEINQANEVLRVVVVDNDMILDEQGLESEALGISFCKSLFGSETQWMQTSYQGRIRKNFAGIGFVFDAERNAFIAPKPEGDYWILDEETCRWYDPALAEINPIIGVTRV
jgi:hypothetical protein